MCRSPERSGGTQLLAWLVLLNENDTWPWAPEVEGKTYEAARVRGIEPFEVIILEDDFEIKWVPISSVS